MKKILIAIVFSVSIITSANASSPTNDFMNLPISFMHPLENSEWVVDGHGEPSVTISEFIKYGLNPKAVFSWEKFNDNEYILTMLIDDKFSNKRTIIKILFSEKDTPVRNRDINPKRALISRMIINGNEWTIGNIYSFALDTCNKVTFLKKQ